MRKIVQLAIACAAALLTLFVNSADASLYGISLNGFNSSSPGPSSLYGIDAVTGAGTLIGTNLGYAVNAFAIDPTTGIMYGSTTSWSGGFNGLLQIDPNTGTATEIGAFGGGFTSILGLTFNSSGNLYGWHDPSHDDPVTINKATGAATTLGQSGINTAEQALAFDSSDNLTLVQGSFVFDINTTTGAGTFTSALSFDPGRGGAAFDFNTGLLWAPRHSAGAANSFIRVSDLGGNSFTDIDTDVQYLSAVTWGKIPVQAVPETASVSAWTLLAAATGARVWYRRHRSLAL